MSLEQKMLMDEASTTAYSAPFRVFPGQAVALSSFNMPAHHIVVVEKIVLQRAALAALQPCPTCDDEPTLPDSTAVAYVEDVTQCGVWHLSACQNVGILSLPGHYRLRLQQLGTEPLALGDVVVLCDKIDNPTLIPQHLLFGNLSSDTSCGN